ncbi:hypothetical protein HBH53_001390 [Parastagonospora nodorum]|nr:hypothetical protein HBH53_001390 [Parastagonospora nodorum]KAH3965568.1 hypothetical protein HBH52_205240 [Parastagonospora nodorum]KAH4058166.1 hypothetical protein HBH49_029540 [Parastagonospora nodorum]KAH4934440.1 hypothetical protein HBI79_085730 [Parastagonospora nodorum]KAH5036745.1 hypothetical protein HBI74_055140 [Parastagonospora nodorum]
MPPRQSQIQQNRIATANRISKAYKWDVNRQNPRPRGLSNLGNDCYRNATLQTLFHLPRFVNWIQEHREGGAHWDCKPDDPNMDQPRADRVSIQMERHGTGCVPCILKTLFQQYWGPYRMNQNGNGEPRIFERDDPALVGLHNLADRWFSRDPEQWSEKLEKARGRKLLSQSEKDKATADARNRNSGAQHDAEEFMRLIMGGVESSYDPSDHSHGARRKTQYDSLFTTSRNEYHTCLTCRERHFSMSRPEQSLRVNPLRTNGDTVEAAIRRCMANTLDGVTKSTCSNQCPEANITVEYLIEAAPEYLCVVLQLDNYDETTGEISKNRTTIQLPDMLDLTEYMDHESADPLPVRYRLASAIYHAGESLSSGHYGAGVTSGRARRARFQRKVVPDPDTLQFFCNDAEIAEWTQPTAVANKLTINPVDFSDAMNSRSVWDPYTLWYVREPQDAPAARAGSVVAHVAPVEEADTIAGRLRERKRKRAESREGL